MAAKITVAICTYRRYDYLDQSIESARAQDLDPASYDILVLDNTPDCAERREWAAKYAHDPRVTYMVLDRPGLSNARNVACETSTAPYIVFLDDDAFARPDWLRHLLTAFETYPDAGVVGGRILPNYEVEQPVWLQAPHLIGYLSVIDWPQGEGPARPLAKSEWLAGASIAFDRAALMAAGGFNVALGRKGSGNGNLLSNEESDAIAAIEAAGKKLYYCGAAEVSHLIPADRLQQDWFRRRAAWQAVSDQLLGSPSDAEINALWQQVLDYYPPFPKELSPVALYVDTDNPDLFEKQIRAIRAATRLALATGKFLQPIKV